MPLSETIKPPFLPPLPLRSGLAMTLFNVFMANDRWLKAAASYEPTYTSQVMTGADGVPLHIWRSPIPPQAKGTLIATYGITGSLDNQGFLRQWGRWAYERGYAVLLFDWRAHGKTAELSPTLTSDGLYEGEDFVHLAAQAKALGYPLFDPTLVPELHALANDLSPADPLHIQLTRFGGHVGYVAHRTCQHHHQDPDELWAIHRSLDWLDRQSPLSHPASAFPLSVGRSA